MFDFYNYTYCIRYDNLERIEQALTSIFKQEGCCRIPLPPLSIEEIKKRYRYSEQLSSDLWVLGLFAGAPGWTIVKTFPQDLLCHRAIGAERPWLSELAIRIGSDAFCLSVYNSHKILMEVDARGDIFISGEDDIDRWKEGKFFDEQINSQETGKFFLLQMPEEEIQKVERAISKEQRKIYEQWEEQFLENYSRYHFPLMTPEELEQWKARWKGMFLYSEKQLQFDRDEQSQQLYDEWLNEAGQSWLVDKTSPLFEQALERLLGGTRSYWYLGRDPLIYHAYTQQQQLEADGVRLLYFRPAEHYRQPNAAGIRDATNYIQTDTEPDLDNIPF